VPSLNHSSNSGVDSFKLEGRSTTELQKQTSFLRHGPPFVAQAYLELLILLPPSTSLSAGIKGIGYYTQLETSVSTTYLGNHIFSDTCASKWD
jgi:hypothetical protein